MKSSKVKKTAPIKVSKKTVTESKGGYTHVSDYIYKYDDNYRVRVTVDGFRHSIYTKSKREAFRLRKKLLGMK